MFSDGTKGHAKHGNISTALTTSYHTECHTLQQQLQLLRNQCQSVKLKGYCNKENAEKNGVQKSEKKNDRTLNTKHQ